MLVVLAQHVVHAVHVNKRCRRKSVFLKVSFRNALCDACLL